MRKDMKRRDVMEIDAPFDPSVQFKSAKKGVIGEKYAISGYN